MQSVALGIPKMDDRTLSMIRDRIETLASATGEYYVVCGRTGERPVPVSGLRFADRATAREAAQTATAYRALLRQFDPKAPVYDFVVCQDTGRQFHTNRTVSAPVSESPEGET